ncbi:50S ribosomal protein L5 (BL6) [Campylobacter hyointestinalis]|uniref:ABC-type transport auxiliary lipoprotein family protein n=1 Tax=Campylobacter hyointestinalis TaxID=198 RepID=UPI0004D77731|nr:ABC-type transport auxiliary lipoprotein family protein [Campylobacter hyointestinalis]ANE32860.1 putative lipid asymmetry ABC transporter MlaABCDEF component MlaB [Campylobacter hyointestinalis subsp. hyointestinalis LMG 9260]KEA43656.1 hypothetical protein CR67_09110 [Campylobacter hyointestinalis subsp. hyointestinalis]QKF56030.1 putative lipid asymmetry ABC transporter MlaABCDEF component MlaB [Campylobacter hyointestinalis subsp. hyointestinalis]TWO30375.1 hypothetical protein YZ79_0336
MKYLFITLVAILLSGCIAKQGVQSRYYELENVAKPNFKCDRSANIDVFIDKIKMLDIYQSRNIIYKQNSQISYLKDAKFASYPNVMIYKSLIDYLQNHCKFKPVLSSKEGFLNLKITILDIYVSQNEAKISAFVSVNNDKKVLVNSVLSQTKSIDKFSEENAINALNLALANIQDQIYDLLTSALTTTSNN